MIGRALVGAGAWLAALAAATTTGAQPALPLITGVDIVSPHRLPEARVQAVIGPLTGQPRSRGLVRDSLERLWALGLFESVRVEEVIEPGGVRLRYLVSRRPHLRSVEFRGHLGVDVAELAAAAGLAQGDIATPERLERARRDVLALYEREGFIGAQVRMNVVSDSATNGRDVTLDVDAGRRARIGRDQVQGADRLGNDFVQKLLGLDEGDRYRQAAVRDGVEAVERAYRDRGFYEAAVRVETTIDPRRDLVDLAVSVEEGPHTRVDFTGADAVGERTLRERLTFADARIVDETEVQASVRQLESLYNERGHAFAQVTGSLSAQGRDRVVRFVVEEGPRVQVEAVEFPDSPVAGERLREHIETQPAGTFGGGWLSREAVTRDARTVAALLRAEGYPEARVEGRIDFSQDQRRARVRFSIVAGPRVTVGTVSVTGAQLFPEQTLIEAVPLRPGDPWSQAQADAGRRLLERRYARRGFHAAQVTVTSRPRNGVTDVVYEIVEGPQTRIGRILIGGLVLTRESVVRRHLTFKAGDPLNADDLLETQRKLAALGLFDRVDVSPLRPPPGPFADVTITIRERKPWHVDVGGGYSTYDGPRALLEVGHNNLFGTARSLTLRGRISERGDRVDLLSYVEPWLFDSAWRGDVNVFRETRDEIGYAFERYGLGLGARRDLWPAIPIRGLRLAVRYELTNVDRFDIEPTMAAEDVQPGADRISALTPDLTLDRRDNAFDPHRGSFHLLSVRTAGAFLGGDRNFVKLRFGSHWLFDWIPGTVLAVSGRLGLATPMFEDDSLPIEERFFAGGATTVRGYRENRLGPLDVAGNPVGGNAEAIINLELRFPIWRWLGGTIFFDTGMVVPEVEDLALNQFKSGVGVGLRVGTPVGPVRLDAGYPLNDIKHQGEYLRFYVNVGYPF